jgi:iron complex transport system ATP-binding protein
MRAPLRLSSIAVVKRGRPILSDVSCEPRSGQVTVLMGPNGAGKTTLLRVMAGLEDPLAGEVALDGRPLKEWNSVERARRVGWIPRRSDWPFAYTVEETVTLGRFAWHQGVPCERDRDAVSDALEEVLMANFRDRRVTELSSGESQKVSLARCLAADPEIILADEPFANLDPGATRVVASCLRARARRGATVVVSSHDCALARCLGDRVMMMSEGRVVADGMMGEIFSRDLIERVFGSVCVEEDGCGCLR